MLRIIALSLLVLPVIGCVSHSTALVHPETEEVRWCEASGWGAIGAPHATRIYSRCVNQLKEQGYVVDHAASANPSADIPPPPEGLVWNERLAISSFKAGRISEAQYRRIRTAVAERYQSTVRHARERLRNGEISEDEYDAIKRQAELDYEG